MRLLPAFLLLAAQQTDFGIRTPPDPAAGAAADSASPPNGFRCRVASVTDGDTFRCADGTRVRLSAIDAPEMPGSCQPGRKCAPGNPFEARAALSHMIAGRTVQCEKVGMSYSRVAAWCTVGGTNLSCAMVRKGHAIRLERYDRQRRMCRW